MSKIGFYRIKLKPTESREVEIYNGEQLHCTINAVMKNDHCCEGVYLKYLDKFGRYRFWMFNDRWKDSVYTTNIGSKSSLISSLLNSQSNVKNLGYKARCKKVLRTGNITQDERDVLVQILTSPRIYIKDSGDDELKNWVLCSDVSGDNILQDNWKTVSNFEITLELPEYYTIKDA